jgi:hypothetical protein
MEFIRRGSIIEAHYLGQNLLLIEKSTGWMHWWHHEEFEFGDGKLYPSSEAALEAVIDVVKKAFAVKALNSVMDEWHSHNRISLGELFHLKMSLMSFLP